MKGANMQWSAIKPEHTGYLEHPGNLEYIELTPADEVQELQNPGVQRYVSSVCEKTIYRCARDDSVYYYYLKDGRVNHGLNITSNLYSLYRDGEIVFQAPLSQDDMELMKEIRESTDNPIIADQFIVRKLRLHHTIHEIGNYNDLPPFETTRVDDNLVTDIFEPEKLDDFPKAETLRQRTIEVFAQALRQQIEENIALGYVQIPETTLPYCREWILTELCEKRGYTVTLDDKLRW